MLGGRRQRNAMRTLGFNLNGAPSPIYNPLSATETFPAETVRGFYFPHDGMGYQSTWRVEDDFAYDGFAFTTNRFGFSDFFDSIEHGVTGTLFDGNDYAWDVGRQGGGPTVNSLTSGDIYGIDAEAGDVQIAPDIYENRNSFLNNDSFVAASDLNDSTIDIGGVPTRVLNTPTTFANLTIDVAGDSDYYTFTAPADGPLNLQTQTDNTGTLEVFVYEVFPDRLIEEVATRLIPGTDTPVPLVVNLSSLVTYTNLNGALPILTAGRQYFVRIEGTGSFGTQRDYSMAINLPLAPFTGGSGGSSAPSFASDADTEVEVTNLDTPDFTPGDGYIADEFGRQTLRAAVDEANANGDADTFTLVSGTYTLTRQGRNEDLNGLGDLDVREDLTITGAGVGVTFIDADLIDRVFHVHPGVSLTLNDMTLRGGDADRGGAILNEGSLVLNNVQITGNTVTSEGGGIYNAGPTNVQLATALNAFRTTTSLTLRDGLPLSYTTGQFTIRIDAEEMLVTAVSGNTLTVVREYNGTSLASHVANAKVQVLSSGRLTGTNVELTGNEALRGGAIANHGDLRLVDTVIRGNRATTSGGGILTSGTHSDRLTVALPTITTAITSIDVENGLAFNSRLLPFNIRIGTEELTVSAISGNTLTVRRAVNSTTAATHVIGAKVLAPDTSSSVLENVVVANNVSLSGGGITNRGEMTIIAGTLIDNEAHIRGGAIFNEQGALSTLNQSVTAVTTSLAVENGGSFTNPTPFVIQVESEQMIVNTVVGNVLTVQRGANGTKATQHSARAAVRQLDSGVLQVTDSYIGKIGTKVSASFDNAVDRFNVDDVSLFTDPVQFQILIGDEQMEVLNIVGNEITVLRARNGTTATSHFTGEPVHLLVDHGNSAPEGGGIANRGSAVIHTSSLSFNEGFNQGGGLFNQGSAWVDSSTLANNTVGARGGAVFNEGLITVLNATISGNSAASRGAGVYSEGTVTLLNSTVTNNSASSASGLENASNNPFRIGNVISAGNMFVLTAGDAPSDVDVSGTFQSLGGNLIGDVDTATGFISTDQRGTSAAPLQANLEPLGGNGGLLLSHEPTLVSQAIDNGVSGLDFISNGGISSATSASPIVITSSNHRLFDGEILTVTLRNAAGATTLTGEYIARVIDRHTFSLQTPTGAPVSGTGLNFAGGGVWTERYGRDQRGSRRGVSAVSVIPTPDAGAIERFVTSPLPFFTVTPNPTAPSEVVRLDATGSRHSNEPIGQIVSYLWDLDADGLFDDETGPIVQLSFDVEGSFPVRLKVIDNFGVERTTATQTILVDAPDPPVILKPSAPVITDHTPKIIWTDVGEHFDLVVSEIDSTGAIVRSQVIRQPTLEESFYSVPTKLKAGIYRAWVRSFSSRGIYSAFSSPFDFEIRDMVITGPATSFDRTPEITWTAIPGATNYEIWVADITRRISPVRRFRTIAGNLTKFEVPIGDALPAGRYRLEMRATDLEDRVGDWSNLFFFDVTAPVITSPPSPTASTVSTDFNLGSSMQVLITSVPLGPQGSAITVLVKKEDLGPTAEPVVTVVANQITVSLNANAGNVSTAQDFIDALNNDNISNRLVRANLVTGLGSTDVTATSTSAGTLLSLAGGLGNGIFDATPLITWTPLPNVHHYVVNVETFANGFRGGNIVHTGNLVLTSTYEIPDRLAPGDYYVTVDAVDVTGETSNRSPGHVIRVDLNQKVDTGIRTTLPSGIQSAATQIVLNDITKFTQATPFQIQIEAELMTVTRIDAVTKTLTVLRGINGTTAVSHRFGEGVRELDGKTSPVGAEFNRQPQFKYKPLLGADSYNIWVTLLATDLRSGVGWSGIIRELGNTSDRLAANANLASGNYRWQVRAVTDDGTNGPWSDYVNFTVPVVKIETPARLGTTFTVARPTFVWNAVGINDLDDYEIWVDKVLPNGAGVDIRRIYGAKGLTGLQTTVPFDLPNGEYTIEMRTFERDNVDGGGVYRSEWSPTHRFQINSQLPDSPVLIGPVGVQPTRLPTFTWVPSPQAVAYQVFIKNLTNGQIPVLSAVVNTNSFTPAGQFTPGIYRWWVRAFDVGGASSGWSSPREFTIVQALPGADGGTDSTEPTDATPEVLVAALANPAAVIDESVFSIIDAGPALKTSDPFGGDKHESTPFESSSSRDGETAPYQMTSWVHAAVLEHEPVVDSTDDADADVIDYVLQNLSSLGWADLEPTDTALRESDDVAVESDATQSDKTAWALALAPLGLGRFWTGKRRNRKQDEDV
ncbi:MAG: hypothetical protein O3A00_02725 [Planctomycetota bacterium]|nr:hypothetical protein [Planctomycetota bacterium]